MLTRHSSPIPHPRVYIGIGSNMGDRLANCRRAVEAIASAKENRILRCSPFYETEPVGKKDQEWFINGVIAMETAVAPRGLLEFLLDIEKGMGRVRKEKWGPRVIDLDILLFGDEVIDEDDLEVPHPRIAERLFVLAPLSDIAPNLRHPVWNQTVSQMRGKLEGKDRVIRLPRCKRSLTPCTV